MGRAIGARICSPAPRPGTRSSMPSWVWTSTARSRGLRARVIADIGAYSIYPWTASIEVIQVISFLPGPTACRTIGARARRRHQQGADGPLPGCRASGVDVRDGVAPRPRGPPARSRSGGDAPPQHDHARGVSVSLAVRRGLGHRDLPGDIGECRARGPTTPRCARSRRGHALPGRHFGIGVASYVELTGVGSAIPVSPGLDHRDGHRGRDPARGSRRDGHRDVRARLPRSGPRDEPGPGGRRRAGRAAWPTCASCTATPRASPAGTGTYASRSAVLGGGAAILASRALREKIVAIAAHQLEASPEDLEIIDGRHRRQRVPSARAVTLRDVARAAYGGTRRLPKGMEPGLETTRFYDPYFGTASNATHSPWSRSIPSTCEVTPAHAGGGRGLRAHHQPAHRGGPDRRRLSLRAWEPPSSRNWSTVPTGNF